MNEEMSGRLNILVSVNCTTYNHENFIAEAIESFVNQITDFKYEILIGEDCSTDNTRKIVDHYANLYPDKIRIITSPTNIGARKNSQRLIQNSKGKYIAECEGDDYWTDPNKLQRQVDYMENHPDCTLCFHSAEIIQAPSKRTDRFIRPYVTDQVSPMEDIITGGGGFCPTPSLFYPKNLMENPPHFYETAPIGDYPMQMLLASHGYAYYMDKCMCAYRSGVEGSWTNRMILSSNNREKVTQINSGIINLLNGFNEYSEYRYKNEIAKVQEGLEYELLILQKKRIKNKTIPNYSLMYKVSVHLKVFLRCNYPQLFMKLSSLKTTKYMKKPND
ncbi:glycosyltransferase [Psychrobacillus sp. INOP01]|uniref:glycosyltransferase n=1 Tax=Psychrobacillus sp. INOP01 TaxID=2829187 RepID=UPI001BAB9B50|nr:glycosyltransferase [Psychrobacillus sp. INOP01]QUG42562.1 glycosyltransferase [Psychrobacillus sp. INOP01]